MFKYIEIIIIFAAILGVAYTAYHLHKKKRRRHKRGSDKKRLSKHQKKIYGQAKLLIQQNRQLQAARLLESAHLEREAITLLESNGYIHEAARILLRLRRPSRAGVVYARNKYFTNAAQCFLRADMHLEAAQCARSSGDLELAASCFEKANEFSEAAQTYVALNDLLSAARTFQKAKKYKSSMATYKRYILQHGDADMTKKDVKYIAEWFSYGHFDSVLVKTLVTREMAAPTLVKLDLNADQPNLHKVVATMPYSQLDQLLLKIDFDHPKVSVFAEAMEAAGLFERAGMIHERLEKFKDAALCFSRGGDHHRAAFLYERAGMYEEAKSEREKQSGSISYARHEFRKDGQFQLMESLKHDDQNNRSNEAEILRNPIPASEESSEFPFALAQAHSGETGTKMESENSSDQVSSRADTPKNFFAATLCLDLSGQECVDFWNIGTTLTFPSHDIIKTPKEESRGLYFLVSGGVEIKMEDGSSIELQPGEFFELDFVFSNKSTHSRINSTTESKVWIADQASFERFLDIHGALCRKLYKTYNEKLASQYEKHKNDTYYQKVN